jgi:hypothetical protein
VSESTCPAPVARSSSGSFLRSLRSQSLVCTSYSMNFLPAPLHTNFLREPSLLALSFFLSTALTPVCSRSLLSARANVRLHVPTRS